LATYQELKVQMAELQQQADAARLVEFQAGATLFATLVCHVVFAVSVLPAIVGEMTPSGCRELVTAR
jgi:hypothetical protein